jgi:hypothetical protein
VLNMYEALTNSIALQAYLKKLLEFKSF